MKTDFIRLILFLLVIGTSAASVPAYDGVGDTGPVPVYDPYGQGADWPAGIICDTGDGLYLGGTTYGGTETNSDYLLLKYNH